MDKKNKFNTLDKRLTKISLAFLEKDDDIYFSECLKRTFEKSGAVEKLETSISRG